MASIILWLATHLGVTQKVAKFGLIGFAVVSLIVGLGVAKCSYDKSIVTNYVAKAEVKDLKTTVKANEHAANKRIEDTVRISGEAAELQRNIDHADAKTINDVRASYYECVRRQQLARKQRKQSPACS